MNKRNGHFEYRPVLDGIRAIAVISILIFHTGAPWFLGGFLGVDIFFVLSGFLITSILLTEWDRDTTLSFRNFYLRRALRLLPALITLLSCYCVIALVISDRPMHHLNDAIYVLFYISNWTRAFGLERPDVLAHAWSLSIEEQFYMIWPLLLYAVLRKTKSKQSLFLAIVFMILLVWGNRALQYYCGMPETRVYNGFDTRADELLVGCLLAVGLSAWPNVVDLARLKIVRFLGALSSLAIIVSLFMIRSSWAEMYYYGYTILALMTAFVIYYVLYTPSSIIQAFLQTRPMLWIGKISYGLYLWHYPFMYYLNGTKHLGWKLSGSIGIPLTFICAYFSYYFIERRFLLMKDRFQHFNSDTQHISTESVCEIKC